jgi:hypothetical protein
MNSLEEKLKDNNYYKVKTVSAKVEDIDSGSRRVKVVLNTMNFLDSDRDIIRNGAFIKSINERGPSTNAPDQIQFLRHHDWEQQIGKYTELYEQGDELIGVGILSKSTDGNNALEDYDLGIINQHSIGFQYIKDKIKFIKDSQLHKEGHYEVNEVKMFEGSAVAFGANKLTATLEVAKSTGDYTPVLSKLSSLSNSFSKALKYHKGTDEHIKRLEYQFLQIQEIQNSLKSMKPSIKDTLKSGKPSEKGVFDFLLNN